MRCRFVSVSAQELEYYRAHFLEARREDGVVCLECGAVYKSLGRHIITHGVTLDDYREKWGYNRGTALMAPALREAHRERALARDFGSMGPPDSRLKALEARRRFTPPYRLESRLALRAAQKARAAAGAGHPQWKVEDETLRRLVGEGLTFREIAARTRVSYSTARQRIRALGLVSPAITPRVRKVDDATLLALCEAGLGNRDIAARTGMTVSAVRSRLDRLRGRGIAVPEPAGPGPTPWRRMTDEELLALVGGGVRASEIAARVGVSPASVWARLRALRACALLPARPRRRVSDEEFRALVLEGLTRRQIAARTGLDYSTVRARLGALGLVTPSLPPDRRRTPSAELLALRQAGLSNTEIAARTGMSVPAVRQRLRLLRRKGATVPPLPGPGPNARPRVSDDERVPLAQAGLRPAEIAARVGIGPSSLRTRLASRSPRRA